MKCQACERKQYPATWSWQPFGPDEDIEQSFTLPGSHYRGFPVIKLCASCKHAVQYEHKLSFSYRGNTYMYAEGVIANCTSRAGSDLPVRKADLIGHKLERDTSLVELDSSGTLRLVHVQAYLDDGRCILFNGEVPIPLKDFKWIEA